jgi:hypothetical protein
MMLHCTANVSGQHHGFISKSQNVYQEQRTFLGISTIENEASTLPPNVTKHKKIFQCMCDRSNIDICRYLQAQQDDKTKIFSTNNCCL